MSKYTNPLNKAYYLFFTSVMILMLFVSCQGPQKKQDQNNSEDTLSGTLTIFHAGSLSMPVKEICDSFTALHPNVKILTEAAGSKECARKISELHKNCDVFLSADYKVIYDLLIPDHASWCIPFATNEMAIVFTEKSKYAEKLDSSNWMNILTGKDVRIARSDPDSDPCGVRAVLCILLAEKYYSMPGLAENLLAKDKKYIRPKETDLIALLETHTADYIFLYRSVAEQHQLKYILLPDQINLKNPAFSSFYETVSIKTRGKKPNEFITEKGAPMIYGLTIPQNAENKALAEAFLLFFLSSDKGMAIMERNGQPSVVPSVCKEYDFVPVSLRNFVKKAGNE